MKRSLIKVFGMSTASFAIFMIAALLICQLGLASIQYFTVGQSGTDIFATDCGYTDVLQYTKSFIPESIQKAVSQQGYTLKLTDVRGGMLGEADPLTKEIIVQAIGEDGPVRNNEFAALFIHEYGHAVSYTYGHLSESKEFKAIYQEGLSKNTPIFDSYTLQNESEYFAESFMVYIVARDQLRGSYPETAKFFDEFFTNANTINPRAGWITYTVRSFDYMFEKFTPAVPLVALACVLFGLYETRKRYKLEKTNSDSLVSNDAGESSLSQKEGEIESAINQETTEYVS